MRSKWSAANAHYTPTVLEAYCSPLSVPPAGMVALHISSDHETVDIRVERDGADPEAVFRADAIRARSHDTPGDASANGCEWPATLEIPTDGLRSGYYAVTLTADDEHGDACFVVRPAVEDPSPVLLVLATTTWNAYNDWGGRSLYSGGTSVSF